ncbi:hypothetical protein FHW84_001788 [Dyella sp. SG562]|uniref:hypothetical protein n=1 Tax=Dyella sp. SG562 TaxID=2587017 RepID=UPI00142039D9|nr:hypothetical protein [Dyella sp. SG562]NII73219.1 hypothetical protein [Dyella sp. SG562]
MNNVHPIFKEALAPFAPKPQPPTLDDVLKPYEVDISPSHHAEPTFVTPSLDIVKAAAAEVLQNHPREMDDVIVRMIRDQRRGDR